MAEFVQQSIEEMLPELEQMERVGLFTKLEIRQILKKRKIFEYKLRRQTKVKDDYLQYIQYEINTLALVRKRRDRTGYQHKKVDIDVAIVQRIHKLFRLVLIRFQDDVKLWLSYIEFSKQRREKATVSRLYTKLLQVHDKKPNLWVLAAKYEFEDNANPENARALLQRALRCNPLSKTLWLEYYRLELLFAEKMRKRKALLGSMRDEDGETQDSVLSGDVAAIVYKQALQAFPDDVHFLLSFLPVCQLFDFTKDQEDTIYKDVKERFPSEAVTWDALARRCLKGPVAGPAGDDPEIQFHKVYEEAVNAAPSGEIWSLYIKACLELLDDAKKKSLQKERLKRALLVFEEAKEAGHLTAQLWLQLIDVLCNGGLTEKCGAVVQEATAAHPDCVDLWRRHLEIQTTSLTTVDDVQATLTLAQKHIPQKDTWPLVRLVLDYSASSGAADNTVRLLESSMIGCKGVSEPAKELYLETEYLKHGIPHTRKIYKRVADYKPVSLQFYKSYISMEMAQDKSKVRHIRKAYEDAVLDHGDSSADIWLDYMRMEVKHRDGKPESVGRLHHRAVKALKGPANQEFIRKYTLDQDS